jgi:hypothetical protein
MSAFPHSYTQIDHQGAADNAIPESLMSSRVPKAIPTLNRIVSIPSASGSASASGSLNWVLPGGSNSNGFLRAGSLYLRFSVKIDKGAGGADNLLIFGNQVNSAASLINRLQITANGTMLETINRYDNYHALLLSHAMNSNYVNNDCSITEYANTNFAIGAATTTTFNIALPLCSAVFSNQKSWPLFLSGLNVQIDLNPATAIKTYGATTPAAVTGYTISNAELVYELIQPDYSLLDTIRAQMAQTGKMFEMPMSTALGLTTAQVAGQASFAYNVGLNLASVSAVLLGEIVSAIETTTTGGNVAAVQNSFVRNSTEASSNSRRFYLDGKQMVNYDVWSDSQNFNETQRALSVLLDPANTTIATRATYCALGETAGQYYIVGQSARRFSEQDVCMAGTPCQNLVIQLAKTGANILATSVYCYIIYDQVVVIDANGSVAVAK